MKQTKLTSKFALILMAILVFVFVGAFGTTLLFDNGSQDSTNYVADAGSNTAGGTEYTSLSMGSNDILSGTNNTAYWWDYQTGSYGGTSAANATDSKYGYYYKAEFKGSRSSTQACMIYLRLPSFMTTTKATISIGLKCKGDSSSGLVSTHSKMNCAMEATKRTSGFGESGLYISEKSSGGTGSNDAVSHTYTKTYENLGVGGCVSVGVWSEFKMDNSSFDQTRTLYCVITSFTVTLEGTYNTGTITYNANGGSGSATQSITYGTDFTLNSGSGFSKTGYNQTKWNTAAYGSGTNYNLSQSITNDIIGSINLATATDGTQTLYAVWAKNTYTLTFNGNGGKTSGGVTTTTQTLTYDTSQTLDANPYVKDGYTFVGWSSNSAATTPSYTDGQSGAFNFTSTNNGSYTLYAVWKASDFGKLASGTTGVWGSLTNPFVISNSTQLINLAEIVNNTRQPVDSVSGEYYGKIIVTKSKIADTSFEGCYFVITQNIVTDLDYSPIGISNKYCFSGTIYGGNGTYSKTHSQKTIYLNIKDSGYVGLFGYTNQATIDSINVAGSINVSSDFAGGIVAFAKDTVVTNCGYVSALPEGYQELEYIKSTGTQYINTGVTQSNKATVDAHFYIDSVASNYLYGDKQDHGAMMYNGLYKNNALEYNWLTISFTAASDIVMTQRISGENTLITINGTTYSAATGNNANLKTIYLFACNDGARLYGNLRCYYFRMYENNEVVRNFIPCKQNSNNAIGMYDTVSGVFYPNAGEGTFEAGPVKSSSAISSSNSSYYSYVGGIVGANISLPSAYTLVDAISFDGTQVYDTGIKNAATWEYDIQFTKTNVRQLMGYNTSASNYWGVNANGIYESGGHPLNLLGVNCYAGSKDYIVEEYSESSSSKKFYLNGQMVLETTDVSGLTTNYTLGKLQGGYDASFDLYGLKCTQGGKVVRNYIPCKRNSDSVYGLFDIITNTFYAPTSGTVSYSNYEIPSTYTRVEYVAFDGNQYLQTGVQNAAVWTYDIQFTKLNARQLMGYNSSSCDYWGINASGIYESGGTWGSAKAGNRDIITEAYYNGKKYGYVNGVQQYTSSSYASLASNYSLGNLGSVSGSYKASFKLFGLQTTQNGKKIRDYIPCKRNSDSVVGLYDLVNRTFTVPVSGTLTAGSNYSEYTYVDYIEASGTQQLNLDVTPTSSYKISMDFAMTKTNVTSALWCARGSTTSENSLTSFYVANSKVRFYYGVSAEMYNYSTLTIGARTNITMDANKWYVNGVLEKTFTAASFTAGGPIKLFASYVGGINSEVGNYSNLKLYRFSIWDGNGVLIRDLIPCYRNIDNAIGLFDVINSKFYPTTSGTLTKGSNASLLKGLTNEANITGYNNLGGIVGYSLGSISNVYSSGTIEGNYGVNGGVGGIVGHINGTVSYAYNRGNVTGVDNNYGSIVGITEGNTLDFVYNQSSNTKIYGTASSISSDQKAWNIGNAKVSSKTFGMPSSSGISFAPAYIESNTYTECNWKDIVSKYICGITINATTANGKYLSVVKDDNTTYATPTSIVNSTRDTDTTSYRASTAIAYSMKARYNFLSTSPYSVIATIKTITSNISTGSSKTYDGAAVTFSASGLVPSTYTYNVVVNGGGDVKNVKYSGSTVTNYDINLNILSKSGGIVVGTYHISYTINPKSINNGESNILFGYSGKAFNTSTFTKNSTTNYYLNSSYSDSVTSPQVKYTDVPSIIFKDSNYTANKFNIYYGDTGLTINTDFTVSTLPTIAAFAVYRPTSQSSPSVTITGKGNYTGSYKVWFTLMDSDFGKSSSGTGVWGTSTNPYLISCSEHFLRLSNIVNGENSYAWNSIQGVNGVGTADATATSHAYENCYFEITTDISVSKAIGFSPVGISSKPFRASQVNGGNKTITITYSNTSLDYVGLFGYTIGTNFLDIKTAGTVSGKQYVGGLVAYLIGRLNGTIVNTATVTGTSSYVGGICGYLDSSNLTQTSYIKGSNSGAITGTDYTGGAIGLILPGDNTAGSYVVLNQFSNTGAIKGNSHTGGIVGRAHSSRNSGVKVSFVGCKNTGSVTGASNVAGILGSGRDAKLYGCINGTSGTSTNVAGTSSRVGGILGYTDGLDVNTLISGTGYSGSKKNINYMAVSGTAEIGGFAGGLGWAGNVVDFENYGAISASDNNSRVGGVIGSFTVHGATYTVQSVINNGAISGKERVGGIIGRTAVSGENTTYTVTIKNVSNKGLVSGTNYVAGFIGNTETYLKIEGTNTNTARITGTGNYVAGIVGNAINAKLTGSTIKNEAVVQGSATSSYVGGLFGYINLIEDITSGTFESYGSVLGQNYIGGIAGKISVNSKSVSATFKVGTNANTLGGEIVVCVGQMGGGLFGYVGTGGTITFASGTLVTGQMDSGENGVLSGMGGVLGGIAGVCNGVVLDLTGVSSCLDSGFSIISRKTIDVSIPVNSSYTYTTTDASVLGAICGYNTGTIKLPTASTLTANYVGTTTASDGMGIVGGIVGLNSGTINGVNVNIAVCRIDGTAYRTSCVGGICGYNAGTIQNFVKCDNPVYGTKYVGGLIGYNPGTFVLAPSSTYTSANVVDANGSYVGGIVGYSDGYLELKNIVRSAAVNINGSAYSNFIGGFVGIAEDASILDCQYTNSSIAGVSYIGGIAGYMVAKTKAPINNNTKTSAVVSASGSYVGGICGFLSVEGEGLLTSYTPEYKNGTSMTVTGWGYVGGLFGYIKGGGYKLNQSGAKSTDSVIHIDYTKVAVKVSLVSKSTQNEVIGGLFGYIADCGVVFDKDWSTSYAFNATSTNGSLTATARYIGGIAGIIGHNATIEWNNSATTETGAVITANMTMNITGSYVGGIAGYVLSYAGAYSSDGVYKIGNLIKLQNVATITGSEFVGGLFGYIGDSIRESYIQTTQTEIVINYTFAHTKADLVGAVQSETTPSGYDENNYCYYYSTSGEGESAIDVYTKYYYQSIINSYTSTNISSYTDPSPDDIIYYKSGSTYRMITYIVPVGTGQYIYEDVEIFTGTTEYQELLKANLLIASYDNKNYKNQLETIEKYGVRDTSVFLVVEPVVAINEASITANTKYAGGLVGYVGTHARLNFVNSAISTNSSDSLIVDTLKIKNGKKSANIVISSPMYCGGIVGYLTSEQHTLTNVLNFAEIGTSTSKYVGGIAGYANNGTFTGCVSTAQAHIAAPIDISTNNYKGSENVGGLIGLLENGNMIDCYAMGYKFGDTNSSTMTFTSHNTSATKGGTVGKTGGSVILTNVWAFYYAPYITYENVAQNSCGQYALIDSRVALAPRFGELCVMAGIYTGTPNDKSAIPTSTALPGSKSYVSIGLNINIDTLQNNRQVAFYLANGKDEEYPSLNSATYTHDGEIKHSYSDFSFSSKNDKLYIKFSAGLSSIVIAITEVKFQNVPKSSTANITISDNSTSYSTDKANFESKYVRPSNYSGYSVGTYYAKYGANSVISQFIGTIVLNNGDVKYNIGSFNQTATEGDTTSPILISTTDQLIAVANAVKGGNSYSGKHIKLTTNIEYTSMISNMIGDSTHPFSGEFDGDGYYINIGSQTANGTGVSLFPYASGAVIKNLTINGSIAANGNESIAAYVGQPNGTVDFENCVNNVSITNALKNVGGFVGNTGSSTRVSFTTCINNGAMYSTSYESHMKGVTAYTSNSNEIPVEYGTGGVFGNGTDATIIEVDSCKNTGYIQGGQNVGGIAGRVCNRITFYSCANTGEIWAVTNGKDKEGSQSDGKPDSSFKINSCCGGILGKSDGSGSVNMYATYNSAQITGYGSCVGGLVGSIGRMTVGRGVIGFISGGLADVTTSTEKSYISYCYNSGLVQAGGTAPKRVQGWRTLESIIVGTIVGGLVGFCGSAQITYCYNTGNVISWGGVGYAAEFQYRAGGIVGQAQAASSTLNVNIQYCYNIGLTIGYMVGNASGNLDDDIYYGAAILGYIDDPLNSGTSGKAYTTFSNNYSLQNSVFMRDDDSKGWVNKGKYVQYDNLFDSGTQVTLDVLTAYHNATTDRIDADTSEFVSTSSSAETLVTSSGADVNYKQSGSAFQNGTLNGWIYPYGCLPQLAVFAIDSKEGLSMLATSYGRDAYGNWVKSSAGSEESPYIITDGIDILGMQALCDADANGILYSFNGKYIEFANGSNNISNTTSKTIILANSESSLTSNYVASSSSDAISGTIKGKSYHIYSRSAVCSDSIKDTAGNYYATGTAYNTWKTKNTVYADATNTASKGISQANLFPIARLNNLHYFSGNLSGEQADGTNTIIQNMNMNIIYGDTLFVGLFARVQNGTVSYITINGSIVATPRNTSVYTQSSGGLVAAGAIAGFVGGSSTIDHCYAGSAANKFTIETSLYSENPTTYTGGIVGLASSIYTSNKSIDNSKKWSDYFTYSAGSTLTISNCVCNSNVTTYKNNAGGIIGYASGSLYNTSTKSITYAGNTSIRVKDCNVAIGTITAKAKATSNNAFGTCIGGIAGDSDDTVELDIDGCTLGNAEYLQVQTTQNVKIIGENKVGGIIGVASKGNIIGSTSGNPISIYGDVLITRGNSWGDVTQNIENSVDYGVSIGGLAGFCRPDSTRSAIFAGTINTYCYVLVNIPTKNTVTTAVGGLVGYMGSGAVFREGCNITIDGIVEVAESIASQEGIGGVAGIAYDAAFDGTFKVYASINASNATKVGGFIGYIKGNTHILAGQTAGITGANIVIASNIHGISEIGGFVGYIGSGSSLSIGMDSYDGVENRLGSLNIHVNNGAYIISTGNSSLESNVGGIVGSNEGAINADKGTITNSGSVVAGAEASLPSAYQGLEYVQTTGSQYFNTGYVPNNTTGFEMVISSQDITSDLVYMGQRPSTDARSWIGNEKGQAYFGWNTLQPGRKNIAKDAQYTFALNYKNCRYGEFNGERFGTEFGTLTATTNPLIIGAGYNRDTINCNSKIKIYSIKISSGNNIVRQYIPCIRKSDNKAGLYEVITGSFLEPQGGNVTASTKTLSYAVMDNGGGFVGKNAGSISLKNPTITNEGAVSGRDNIGGIVGLLATGTIAGSFTNSGDVNGRNYVGGSFGKAENPVIFTVPTQKTSGGAYIPTSQSNLTNSGKVTGVQYVGGSIGLLLGKITGMNYSSRDYLVAFTNTGNVTTNTNTTSQYIGGSVGALAGTVTYASFANRGKVTTLSSKAIGGSIGIAGLPSALSSETPQPTSFSYTHFESSASGGLDVGPTSYSATTTVTTAGAVGGAIGAIYNATSFTSTNSFYTLGNVTAKYLYNVGGSIGLIQGGGSITVNGLLSYNTRITGYQNVGGIVGAIKDNANVTISNAYNVSTSLETNENLAPGVFTTVESGKVYGGIVGLTPSTTVAETAYWIKGFPNAELASLNIANVKNVGHFTVEIVKETFTDVYSLAATVYNAYDEDIKYYSRTGSGTEESPYVYTQATGVTAANYGSYYVNTYPLSIQFCNTHNIASYLELTNQSALATSVFSWDEYVATKFKTKVDALKIYMDGNGNYVEMTVVGDPYTTGTKSTGHYFLYAKDTGTIDVIHTEASVSGYAGYGLSDIDYWKRIANAYTAEEIAGVQDTRTIRSTIAPYTKPDGATTTAVTSVETGGKVVNKYLYAKASSEYQSGYFLYMKATSDRGLETYHDSATTSTDFYITANIVQKPENVVIYYRTVGMGSALTYNGNERFAPLTLKANEIGYLLTAPTAQDTSKVSKYYYMVSGDHPTATNVGSYTADIILYYYDSTGRPYRVGAVEDGTWAITARQLKIKVTPQAGTYDGNKTVGNVEVVIENFSVSDANNATIKIKFVAKSGSKVKDPYTFLYTLGTNVNPSGGGSSSSYIQNKGSVDLSAPIAMSTDAETKYNVDSTAPTQTYKSTFNFTFKNALSYDVIVEELTGTTGHAALVDNYIVNSTSAVITVNARELKAADSPTSSSEVAQAGYKYTGATYTNDIFITGWADSDKDATARATWFYQLYPYKKDNLGNVTYYRSGANGGSDSDPLLGLVTSGTTSKVSVSGVDKGFYYFGFNSNQKDSGTIGESTGDIYTEDGNYKIKLSENPKSVISIVENSIKITWSNGNKTYDGSTTTKVATLTATFAFDNADVWDTILYDYSWSIQSKDNVKNNPCNVAPVLTKVSTTVAKITYTTNKNADTYVAKITGPLKINPNCPVDESSSKPAGTENSRKFWTNNVTISKKALTATFTPSSISSSYVYNTAHQGVTFIGLTGFISGENITKTGNYGEGNGTNITKSGPDSTFAATKKESDNGYTVTSNGFVGSYSISIGINATYSNYTVSSNSKSWTITPYEIVLGTQDAPTTSVYTGQKQIIEAKWGTDTNITGSGTTRKFHNDTIYINFVYASTTGTTGDAACNVGTYTMTLATTNSVKGSRTSGGLDTSACYSIATASKSYTATHEITPAQVTVAFTNGSPYVYLNEAQGPKMTSAVIGGKSKSATTSTFTESTFAGLYGTEVITIKLTGSGKTAAGSYTASTGALTVAGNNELGASIAANFSLTSNSAAFVINKSIISVSMNATTLTKVYDGTNVANVSKDALILKSTNGGYDLSSTDVLDNSGTENPEAGILYGLYNNKNVGTNKVVTFSIKNNSTTNYIFSNNSNEWSNLQLTNGAITRRPVTIAINFSRNKATKTYDGTNTYATYTNGNANNRSVKYKSGQGFTVANVVAGDDFIVDAVFKESISSRSYFDSFINNITREGTEGNYVYSKTTGFYKMLAFTVRSNEGDDYKNYSVEITGLTEAKDITSNQNGENVINLYDSRETDTNKKNADTTITVNIEITSKTITASYTNTTQSYANDDNSFNLYWKAVTGTSSGIISSDNVQFYMNNGWMYKSKVDPNPNTTGHDITQEEIDNEVVQQYAKYTTIRGSASSQLLRATLVSDNGRHFNYVLRQQPTLTIGYFVNQDGYEINSYAGLMLATYYYSTNFMETTYDDSSIATTTLINTWKTTFTLGTITTTCSYSDYENNVLPSSFAGKYATWDDFFDAFVTAYNAAQTNEDLQITEVVYEGDETTGAWGYWVNVPESRTAYLEFKQTRNIDARLTANDIAIIEGQFGATWGLGTKYLSNFIKCSAGDICVAVNAIFPLINVSGKTYGFVGTYNGNGYVINNMTIVGNYSSSFTYGTGSIYEKPAYGTVKGGYGMFALVNSNTLPAFTNISTVRVGYVSGINLRNANIMINDSNAATNSNKLSVGGIIGISQMATTLMNCSFHGSIVVNVDGVTLYVGGIIGYYGAVDDSSEFVMMDGIIVAGTINTYNGNGNNTLADSNYNAYSNVGGAIGRIGGLEKSKNIVIKNIVSIANVIAKMETTASGRLYAASIVGVARYTKGALFAGSTVAFVTNSTMRVYKNSSGNDVTALCNTAAGVISGPSGDSTNPTGTTYDELRNGSKTAYSSTVYSPTTLAKGTYDVIEEVTTSTNQISTRLVDIIDIYVLMYTLTAETTTTGEGELMTTTTIYKKQTSSPLVGSRTGKNSSSLRFIIGNQERIAWLREFPFATFYLDRSVSMYRGHDANQFEGYFYGNISRPSGKTYTINLVNNETANMFKWNPLSKNLYTVINT